MLNADGLTVALLVMIVILGMVGIAVIGGVYCVRVCRHRRPSRDRYEYEKPADTDPLLMTPPP